MQILIQFGTSLVATCSCCNTLYSPTTPQFTIASLQILPTIEAQLWKEVSLRVADQGSAVHKISLLINVVRNGYNIATEAGYITV